MSFRRFLKHIAREGRRGVGCATRDADGRPQRMQLHVEQKRVKLLLVVAGAKTLLKIPYAASGVSTRRDRTSSRKVFCGRLKKPLWS